MLQPSWRGVPADSWPARRLARKPFAALTTAEAAGCPSGFSPSLKPATGSGPRTRPDVSASVVQLRDSNKPLLARAGRRSLARGLSLRLVGVLHARRVSRSNGRRAPDQMAVLVENLKA